MPDVPPAGQLPTPGGFIVGVSARSVSRVQLRRPFLREAWQDYGVSMKTSS
jgi:hypothetical protein